MANLEAGWNERSEVPVIAGWRRAAYLALAGLCFLLAVAGAVLPGLPATPFLLLTSGLLVKSSPRLHSKLLNSRWFGPILRDWRQNGGVRRDVRAKAIVTVLAAVTFTVVACRHSPLLLAVVVAGAAVGLGVILKLPGARST